MDLPLLSVSDTKGTMKHNYFDELYMCSLQIMPNNHKMPFYMSSYNVST